MVFAVVVVGVASTRVPTSSMAHGDTATLHNLTLWLLRGQHHAHSCAVELLGGINFLAVRPGRENLILHLNLLVPCRYSR